MRALASFLGVVLVGCASAPPPSPVGPADTEPPPMTTQPPAGTGAAAGAAADDAQPARSRPLDLTSACPHDVHLYFGDHPGDGQGQPGVVASGAVIPVPRGADGTQVVWVVDDKGFGLGNVHITKHMHHIRIDAACMKIDADSTR